MSSKLTPEQQAVVESTAKFLSVSAFAGTGKTTTLRAYAQARPSQKILYLAFNRAVADEARAKMPPNVAVKTSHALAWGRIASGWPKDKLSGRFNAWTLINQANEPLLKHRAHGSARAQYVVQTINQFCQSRSHALAEYLRTQNDVDLAELELSTFDALELVQRVWSRMTDPDDSLPATHDTYFKLWQLSKPRLNYDLILLDEAQDTNPALFDVFMRQAHANRVLVGDRHQNIYSFRGAMNAMEAIDEPHESLALTHSFRFGQPVADVANLILSEFKNERRRLTGAAPGECVVGNDYAAPSKLKTALLFRTNAGLFAGAASLCKKGPIRLGLLGTFESYAFEDILDTFYLSVGRISDIKSSYIRSFRSYDRLLSYAHSTDDKELKVRAKVIEEHGSAVPHLYRKIRESVVDQAELTLTTAHKSKGAEWPQVILGDDFADLCRDGVPNSRRRMSKSDLEDGREPLPPGEANLWYVAVTRAQQRLVPSPQLREFLGFFPRSASSESHEPDESECGASHPG